MYGRHRIIEEPYEGKLSRTVLKPSEGSDALAQVTIAFGQCPLFTLFYPIHR
jgi:hypothetical protein